MSKTDILKEINNNSYGQNYLNSKFGEIYYDIIDSENKIKHLAFYVKPDDGEFLIHFIREIKVYENNFNGCMNFREKVDNLIQSYYNNISREEISFDMDFDQSGESQTHNVNFFFENGDFITLTCQKYSKHKKAEYNLVDQYNFAIGTKEVQLWFMNPIDLVDL